MPPFVYPEVNYGAAAAIPGIIEQGGQQQAQLLLQAAQARAQGQLGAGQAWGQGLQSLGNLVGNAPGIYAQQAQAKTRAAEAGMRMTELGLQVQKMQNEQQATQAWGQELTNPVNQKDDGSGIDQDKLSTAMAKRGFATQANTFLEAMNRTKLTSAQIEEANNNIQKFHQQQEQAKTDLMAHFGATGLAKLDEPGSTDPMNGPLKVRDDLMGLVAAAVARGALSPQEAQDFLMRSAKAGPQDLRGLYQSFLDRSPGVQQEIQTEAEKHLETQAKIAKDLADRSKGPTPADQQAEAETLRTQQILAEQGLAPPLTPQQEAKVKSYQWTKTVPQTAKEAFDIQEAGRKVLDKIDDRYSTALTSARAIRDAVTGARAGNSVEAALTGLETTMGAIRQQNLSRLNQVELRLPSEAGSWWDRIQGEYGKAVAGQPVDKKILGDMEQFADAMEKSAAKQYLDNWNVTTKRYQMTDEVPRVDPKLVESWGLHPGPAPPPGPAVIHRYGRDPTDPSKIIELPSAPPARASQVAPRAPVPGPPPASSPQVWTRDPKDPTKLIPPAAPPASTGSPQSSVQPSAAAPTGRTAIALQVRQEAMRQGVNPNVMAAIAQVESDFDQRKRSPKGAIGTLQIMPDTARKPGFGIEPGNPYDFRDNVRLGVSYLKALLNHYNGNLDKALAAYNTGQDTVDRHGITSAGREYVSLVHAALRQQLMAGPAAMTAVG